MNSFTTEQIKQLRAVFREELSDAGLRLDSAEHQDEAREDFRFMRKFRKTVDGAASKIGMTVLLAVIGGFVWLFMQGVKAWQGM